MEEAHEADQLEDKDSPSNPNDPGQDQNASPQRKYKNIFLQVCLTILCTEFCERLAFYGLTGSLAIFYTKVCGLVMCKVYFNNISFSQFTAFIWIHNARLNTLNTSHRINLCSNRCFGFQLWCRRSSLLYFLVLRI